MSRTTPIEWRERLASPLTWHYAGFGVLLVLVVILSIRFALDWAATSDSSAGAIAAKQVQWNAMDMETAPLRGLDKRVDESREQMRTFFARRVPPTYSQIAMSVGSVALKAPVRLTRVQYTKGLPGHDLTEISLDAGITGDYPHIMQFVNGLERDQNFFIIRAMALTGQQGGLVNLRLRVSTWLRPADVPSELKDTPADDEAPSTPVKPEKEGE